MPTINYPADIGSLATWSKRLFAVWYLSGLTAIAAGTASIYGLIKHAPAVAVSAAAGLVFALVALHIAGRILSEVDRRLWLLTAERQDITQ